MYCTKCGTQVNENAQVCPCCGNDLAQQQKGSYKQQQQQQQQQQSQQQPKGADVYGSVLCCKVCGNPIADGENVCSVCGNVISKSNPYNFIDTGRTKCAKPQNPSGLTLILTICCAVKVIIFMGLGGCIAFILKETLFEFRDVGVGWGVIIGMVLGIACVVKDMIFANIADNVYVIAKNALLKNEKSDKDA